MSGIKNRPSDLNNILFEQLERLNDLDIKGEELETEIVRAKAICGISGQIIQNTKVVVEAEKLKLEYGIKDEKSVLNHLLEG